eukprot:jgi/Ulvmu1/9918/UM057_0076.1
MNEQRCFGVSASCVAEMLPQHDVFHHSELLKSVIPYDHANLYQHLPISSDGWRLWSMYHGGTEVLPGLSLRSLADTRALTAHLLLLQIADYLIDVECVKQIELRLSSLLCDALEVLSLNETQPRGPAVVNQRTSAAQLSEVAPHAASEFSQGRLVAITNIKQVLSTLPDHHAISILERAIASGTPSLQASLQTLLQTLPAALHPVVLQASHPCTISQQTLVISPCPHHHSQPLPIDEARLIVAAASTLPPLHNLIIQDIDHNACDLAGHSSDVLHVTSVQLGNPPERANCGQIHDAPDDQTEMGVRRCCVEFMRRKALSKAKLDGFFHKLPHLKSLATLHISGVNVGTCSYAFCGFRDTTNAIVCNARHEAHAAAPALAWALQQCEHLQELKLRRLSLCQSSAASIAAAWPALTRLCSLELGGVSHCTTCTIDTDGHAVHSVGVRCTCRWTCRGSAVPHLLSGASALCALKDLTLSGEQLTQLGVWQVLQSVQQPPVLHQLVLLRCTISCGGTLPGASHMSGGRDEGARACILSQTDADVVPGLSDGGGMAGLICTMHAALAYAKVATALVHLSVTQCSMVCANMRQDSPTHGDQAGCCVAAPRCAAMSSVCTQAAQAPQQADYMEQLRLNKCYHVAHKMVGTDGDCCEDLDIRAPQHSLPPSQQLGTGECWQAEAQRTSSAQRTSDSQPQPYCCLGCKWLAQLRSLCIDRLNMPDAQLCSLMIVIPRMTALQELSLSGNGMGHLHAAASVSAALRQLCMLSKILLNNCQIAGSSTFAIFPALAVLPHLQELHMSHNPLRAAGAAAAAQYLPQLAMLSRLSFATCSLGRAGVAILAEVIPQMPMLHALNLARNHVNEATVSVLVEAVQQAQLLRELVVYEEFFSKRAQARLQAATPDACMVVYACTTKYM